MIVNCNKDDLLLVSSSPHVHATGSIRSIMGDVLIALIPAAIASVCFFGWRALILICTCIGTAVFSEYLSRLAMGRRNTTSDLSAIVTGLLLAFNLPPNLPIWMAVIGTVFAIVVAKQVFGGLGYNPFNPALAARAFLLVSFTGAMTTWSGSAWIGDAALSGVTEATPHTTGLLGVVDGMTCATPLGVVKASFKHGVGAPFVYDNAMMWRFFVGNMNGCIGETSALALLLGGAYLIARKVIGWHIPLSFIGTVAVYAAILRFCSPALSMPVSFHLLSGGLLLGAFFMATDMVTTPTTKAGKVVFGIGAGVLTMVIRTVVSGDYPEGVSFGILIMNAFVPLINRFTRKRVFGE